MLKSRLYIYVGDIVGLDCLFEKGVNYTSPSNFSIRFFISPCVPSNLLVLIVCLFPQRSAPLEHLRVLELLHAEQELASNLSAEHIPQARPCKVAKC